MDAKAIAEKSGKTAQSARDALAWAGDARNAAKISQERAAIEQKLRRVANEGMRLQRAALRPTCVGVFGPSQAGKSYLISILARKDQAPLIAKFDGDRPEIDFIEHINPAGGDESTGVVTRFTIHPQPSPPGFPVCLRLLSQTDVTKILINSYFQEGDQEYEAALEPATIERALAQAESVAKPTPVDVFAEHDVWELQEYVQRNSGGAANAAAVDPFWGRIAAVAPRLEIPDRAQLLAILWGRHETYTQLYLKLVGALAQLAFQQDAFCGVPALIPSNGSIINVNALNDINDDGATRFDVSTATGTVVNLPRPVITALVAELRIVCRDRPLPFFEHTDLLDFPGYRSRFKQPLKAFFNDPDKAAKEVILRGKVDLLFQRYTADLELTTMVLCIPESVMEVTSLPKAIDTWVGMTHGSTPEKRINKPTLLFFALTKFDRTLEQKVGEQENDDTSARLAEKFDIRFRASFSAFSKVEPSWVKQWWPRKPFQNLFLIRNPNVRFTGVIDYEGNREVGFNPAQAPRLAALRQAFVSLPTTIEHFVQPDDAWDALMALNDGGAGYLAKALERVCVADLKLGQVQARLDEIRRDVAETLVRYYVSEDLEKRRQESLAMVDDKIFVDLDACAEMACFGSALRGLMIDDSDLHAALTENLNRPGGEPRADAAAPLAAEPPKRPGPFGGSRSPGPKKPPPTPEVKLDRWSRLADAALSCWASFLHARVADPVFGRKIGIGQSCLRDIVAEIGVAARRLDLTTRIATELRLRAAPSENNEAIARKGALVARCVINRFVSELDFDRVDGPTQLRRFAQDLEEPVFVARETAFDTSGFQAEAPDSAMQFMGEWARAFRTTVSHNASKGGSPEDAAENAKLGRILDALSA